MTRRCRTLTLALMFLCTLLPLEAAMSPDGTHLLLRSPDGGELRDLIPLPVRQAAGRAGRSPRRIPD